MSTRSHAQPKRKRSRAPTTAPRRGRARARPLRTRSHAAGPTIVCVGASAGGLEAFAQLLDPAPADSNLSFIFVHHVIPEHAAALPQLSTRPAHLEVVRAEHGMRMVPGHVYVIPPDALVDVVAGRLHLAPRPEEPLPFTPVDDAFRSLARWARDRAIGVVLSGAGRDGLAGVREIKAFGGTTIAQAPETATHDALPRAAIATGSVDLVLPPEQIMDCVTHLARHPLAPRALDAAVRAMTDANLRDVCALLQRVSGIDFRQFKVPAVRRRLARRMALLRMSDLAAYVRQLREQPAEAHALAEDLLVRPTRFFGDAELFAALSARVIAPLAASRGEDAIRVWVPGCGTGEEAYSTAMCLLEQLGERDANRRVQIFATDVGEAAVDAARAGLYPASIAADVSADRLRRFFSVTDSGFRVTKAVRDVCVFARHDLTHDPPFARLDAIVCRNVLTYLDGATQNRLMSLFHYALRGNGALVLGPADAAATRALFAVTDKKWRIFHKLPRQVDGPLVVPADAAARVHGPSPRQREHPPATRLAQQEATRVILDRLSPAAALVDRAYHVIQFWGPTGRYLEAPVGDSDWSVLRLARGGLLSPLRAALESAARRGRSVRNDHVTIARGDGPVPMTIEVVPLGPAPQQHYLVLFSDRGDEQAAGRPAAYAARREGEERGRVAELRRELAATRDYLQSIIQELEAANNDLQLANDEILSSNQELQSTNEELDTAKKALRSANEELEIVNRELHARNGELAHANSDLLTLLGCVDVPIVIVGRRLEVRRFTQTAGRLFNLSSADIGRPFGHLTPAFEQHGLEALIREAIDHAAPRERAVCDRDGRWHMVRIRPCEGSDNRLNGAIITAVEIHAADRRGARGPQTGPKGQLTRT